LRASTNEKKFLVSFSKKKYFIAAYLRWRMPRAEEACKEMQSDFENAAAAWAELKKLLT